MMEVVTRTSETLSIAEAQTDALLRSLECSLCQSRFTCPKECDCGHVFCLECLRSYLEDKQSYADCPTCRNHIKVPDGGVDKLPTHIFYQDLSREVNVLENENKISRGSCKFCSDDEKLLATVKCIACQVPMCENCSSHHRHNGVTNVVQIHRKQDSLLCEILPKRDTACSIHSTESLLLFCVACQCCVCFKCKDEKHSDHHVADLADTAIPSKESISDVQSKLREYLNETKEALFDIERINKEYNENVEATKKQIETQVQMLIDHILKEKEKMIEELEEHADDVKKRLVKNQNEMQGKDERAKSMSELTDNLLMYGNDAENTKYNPSIVQRWSEMQEEKLNRFGQGYKMSVQFFMNEGILTLLSKDIGTLRVTQNLSPWTARKSVAVPFDMSSINNGSIDPSTLHKRIKSAMSNDFSLKRSPIFSKFVDPKWNLETFKTSKSTGQTVTAWLKNDEEQEHISRASKRLSMRSYSAPSLTAEIESFNEKGEHEYRKNIEKLPDGTIMRLAIGGKDTILLAVYPGLFASSIIGQAKLKSMSRKDVDGIYVAVLERGLFVCGELRKIPIPEGPGFDFDISSKGIIVLKPVLLPDIRIYTTLCQETITDHGLQELTVMKIMQSPDSDIIAICRDKDGNIMCEDIRENGQRETRFTFPAKFFSQETCEFKEACFDRYGNVLIHLRGSSQDVLYQVTRDNRKEYLAKPEMLHKVDKLAVLPDGRICVFDKTECVLMTLKYL